MPQVQTHPLFEKHIGTLRRALAAAESRVGWSPYPDSHTARGEAALTEGREAFDAYRDASFYLDQPGVIARAGSEQSPYGLPLNISYPQCSIDALILAAKGSMPAWADAGPDVRAGVCLEIFDRLHAYGVAIAHAVMHTTGQPFAFSYRHSLAGALDWALEAVAIAYREMKYVPGSVLSEKAQGPQATLKIERRYAIAPRGVGLIVGSPTEPTSAGWPGMFASLVAGNAVIVLPNPASVLPLAMSVAVARQVVKEAGFDANLVSLLVDDVDSSSATAIAMHPEIRIIDCAGDPEVTNWLEENAPHAAVFSLKGGANCVVADATSDYKGMLRNLTLSLCICSGQLAAAPRLILVPREGIRTPQGTVPPDRFGRDLAFAVGKLVENPARAVETLGAIRSPALLGKLQQRRDAAAEEEGSVLRDTARIEHPQWPLATVVSPLILKRELTEDNGFLDNVCEPVVFVAETATTAEALASAERIMRERGALNFSVYTDSQPLEALAEDISARLGVALSLNLTGNLLVSQTEAFSDFYATGENPSSTCSLVDAAFVARRFFVVQTRRQIG